MQDSETLVSKANFARLKNVSKARVSQWISEGKIGGEALVGDGPTAKINVRVADAHLNRRLDISQRFGNGLSTRLGVTEAAQVAVPIGDIVSIAAAQSAAVDDPIEEQIKREKLEGLQRENRKRAEEEAARAGRYVDSQSAKAQMAKVADRIVGVVDGVLSELSAAVAVKFKIPHRDVLHLARIEFRAARSRQSQLFKGEAQALVQFIEAAEVSNDEKTNAEFEGNL